MSTPDRCPCEPRSRTLVVDMENYVAAALPDVLEHLGKLARLAHLALIGMSHEDKHVGTPPEYGNHRLLGELTFATDFFAGRARALYGEATAANVGPAAAPHLSAVDKVPS